MTNKQENVTENNNIQELSRESDIRREKIENLKAEGINPYAEKFERTHTLKQAFNLEVDSKATIAGRLVSRRVMGKLMFMEIQDIDQKIQVSLGRNQFDQEAFDWFKYNVNIGDFVGFDGEMYITRTGVKTLRSLTYKLLSKAIYPLPEKFHGLTDIEARYRQRYLDLISNEESRKVLKGRSKLISFIRSYLEKNDFIEVETPILQGAACGAAARPFMTKHNALDKEMNLRIAPEVYLKQVIAGGFDRVFEVAKCFRNEGMDASHLQEFTQVEWYASYWNFEDNIKFFTKFLRELTVNVTGKAEIEKNGNVYSLEGEFPRIDYTETLNKILGFDILDFEDAEKLKEKVVSTGLFEASEFEGMFTLSSVIDYIYKRKIRPEIKRPTILFNYPSSLVPLARRNDKDPRTIEMFQFLIEGEEICKAYSELVDPIVQRETLEEQAKAKAMGDDEAMELDEDFILAMEHGMPPMSGLGFGIDRFLVMLFNQPSIRDVVLFPIMK